MNHGLIPYVGGKHRLANRLAEYIRGTGAEVMVDVFGGSAAVLLACAKAGFVKRVYNDIDGDLVNLFRVLSDREKRQRLVQMLRWLPPSREVFLADASEYRAAGYSFCRVADAVERARRTFYRHLFCFGGKVRSGGFAVSVGDRPQIKEVGRYRNVLRRLVRVAELFRGTMIENLHYSELISFYGSKRNVVLFADPPYDSTENYYSRTFTQGDHMFLAEQLGSCQASVVATYYDTAMVRGFYPESSWTWHSEVATKNSAFTRGNKASVTECVLVKRLG